MQACADDRETLCIETAVVPTIMHEPPLAPPHQPECCQAAAWTKFPRYGHIEGAQTVPVSRSVVPCRGLQPLKLSGPIAVTAAQYGG